MKSSIKLTEVTKVYLITMFVTAILGVNPVQADSMPPEVQIKVETYKKKLVVWASDPSVIEAVKDSNDRGGITGMNNVKWDVLSDSDPLILWLNLSTEGKKITQWEEDPAIDKLILRDLNANLVASSYLNGKPLMYNNASRAPFQNGLKGTWSANEIKPDPTTHRMAVQIAVPVLDGDKVIGVLHSAVLVQ